MLLACPGDGNSGGPRTRCESPCGGPPVGAPRGDRPPLPGPAATLPVNLGEWAILGHRTPPQRLKMGQVARFEPP